MFKRLTLALLLGALAPVSFARDEDHATIAIPGAARIELAGAFSAPFVLGPELMATLPRVQVQANDHGVAAIWEGVRLQDVLLRAGAPLGDQLRGSATALVVKISAADGYRSVFALAEFDAAFGNLQAVLADTRDGKPLSAEEGPFRLVLPTHQRQARSVRQITRIELIDLP